MHAARRRFAVAAGLALTALAGVLWLGAALAQDPAPLPPSPVTLAVDAGTYMRIDVPRGPIHVWRPAGYRPDTGATVIYVHGYWDTADTAWTGHQLPQQFAMSAGNAMYIVPEAPAQHRTPVNYPDLGELLRIVEDATGQPRGAALTVALGHSGAYRTIEAWLDEPLLDQIVMIDALYGEEDKIIDWTKASERRRLILVAQDTVLGAEAVHEALPEAFVLDRVPPTYQLMPAEAKAAKVVYLRAQFSHMTLVRGGVVIPSVLRLLPLELLPDLPWQQPLGSLPPPIDAAPP
ncbi:MAG: hypothetical protein SFX73_13935 [Kofleriaceae bacterium]|nr:hypothetical protein [Kofleriaceae bacterium]